MEKDKTIEVLNSLIEINNDRIKGYETASNETLELDIKMLFFQFVKTSKRCKSELVREVEKLGGTATEETTTSGKLFRVWMDFKSVITGNDRKAILNSCEYGESVVNDTYNDVLSDNLESLTLEQQAMVKAQYMLLKSDYDMVKELIIFVKNE